MDLVNASPVASADGTQRRGRRLCHPGGSWPLGTVRQSGFYRQLGVLTNLESANLDAANLEASPITADAPTSVSGNAV